MAKTAGPGNSSRSSGAGWPRQCACPQLSATPRTSLLRGARFTECASCRGGWDACPEEGQGRAGRSAPRPPVSAPTPSRTPGLHRPQRVGVVGVVGVFRVAHAQPPRPAPRLWAAGWWVWVTWARIAASSPQGASPRAGFRFGGSEMTEPGPSPEDPWVKASPVGAHAGEGRAGRARARRGSGRRGDSLKSPELLPLSGPRGCREDSSHPACAKVGRQLRRVRAGVRGRGWRAGGVEWADGVLPRGGAPAA